MEPTPQERLAPPPASPSLHELLGRNLATYQAIELVIKYISSTLRVEGTQSTIPLTTEAARAKIRSKTMGNVLEDFLAVYDDRPCEPPTKHDGEIWIGMKVSISATPEEVEEERTQLKHLVEERNWLVHHSLLELHSTDGAIQQEALKRLESQHVEAQQLLASLRDKSRMLDETKSIFRDFHLDLVRKEQRLRDAVAQLLEEPRTTKLQPDGSFLVQRFRDLVRLRLGDTPERRHDLDRVEPLLLELRPEIRFEDREEKGTRRRYGILPQ